MSPAVERLLRIAEHRGDADDAEWISVVLVRFLAGENINAAAGLPWKWRSTLHRHRRDELLRRAAAHFVEAPATRLAEVLSRYRSRSWPRTRLLDRSPHPEGSLDASLWLALKEVDRDLSRRQVAAIIGATPEGDAAAGQQAVG